MAGCGGKLHVDQPYGIVGIVFSSSLIIIIIISCSSSSARSFIFRRLDGVKEGGGEQERREKTGRRGGEMKLDVPRSNREVDVFPLTRPSLCVLLSPDDMPAGVGLQESAEQIPGQCSLQARWDGGMRALISLA